MYTLKTLICFANDFNFCVIVYKVSIIDYGVRYLKNFLKTLFIYYGKLSPRFGNL